MRVWGRTQRAGQRLGLQAVGLSGQGPERLQWELERLQGRAELSLEEAGRKAWGPPLQIQAVVNWGRERMQDPGETNRQV